MSRLADVAVVADGPAQTATAEQTAGLRSFSSCGGCAAKMPPELTAALSELSAAWTRGAAGLLVGLEPSDDAAVVSISDGKALVFTVDFFPPVVDRAEDYGAIAASNAVSDIYAMGGDVLFALAISGFPREVSAETVFAVNRSASEVIVTCGGTIVGGHSIHCREPVFGLAVTGVVHPDRVWKKSGARPGDVLVLSKPIGTGVLLSASDSDLRPAIASMKKTNQQSANQLHSRKPHAVTDVTGFGLAGHALEMAQRSNVTLLIEMNHVPLLEQALATADRGVRTSAHSSNERACGEGVTIDPAVSESLLALAYDPQTSGGLLAAVTPAAAKALEAEGFTQIGRVVSGPAAVHLT